MRLRRAAGGHEVGQTLVIVGRHWDADEVLVKFPDGQIAKVPVDAIEQSNRPPTPEVVRDSSWRRSGRDG
jgi:hypothetical protein